VINRVYVVIITAQYSLTHKYIAIEGNIGAGKTTLAELLSAKLGSHLLLEQFADNPFLPDFYRDRERYAFPLEMAFMAERYRQISETNVFNDLFGTPVIADFHPLKSKLFAGQNLPEKEFNLYRTFFDSLFKWLPKPDLLIYLDLPVKSAQENIRRRGRSYEQSIPDEYLYDLQTAYQSFIHQVDIPVLFIDKREVDFVGEGEALENLVDALKHPHQKGINNIDLSS
jgi:deoxyguanosine kinase